MKIGDEFNPYRMFVGSFIPNCLMEYPDLSSSAKLVWARLAQYMGKNAEAWPQQETIAKEVGMTVDTVHRNLAELSKLGFIKIIRPKGTERLRHLPNRYRFLWHKVFESASPSGENAGADSGKIPSAERSKIPSANEENQQSRESPRYKQPAVPSSKTPTQEGPTRLGFNELVQAPQQMAEDERNWQVIVQERYGIRLDKGFAGHIDKWLQTGALRAGVIFSNAADVRASDGLKDKARALYARVKKIAEGKG